MFTIKINFLGDKPPKAAYYRMSIDEIYDYLFWEANLTITYNNRIIFSEDVAIIEFYWYLLRWYRGYLAGNKEQFSYCTVEYTVPILGFALKKSGYWEIDSVWNQCDKPALIKEEILCSEVQLFLVKIMEVIEKEQISGFERFFNCDN